MTVLRVAGVIFNMRQRETEAALRSADPTPSCLPSRPVPSAGGSARRAGYFARTGPDGSSRWAVPLSQCDETSVLNEPNRGFRFRFAEGLTEARGEPPGGAHGGLGHADPPPPPVEPPTPRDPCPASCREAASAWGGEGRGRRGRACAGRAGRRPRMQDAQSRGAESERGCAGMSQSEDEVVMAWAGHVAPKPNGARTHKTGIESAATPQSCPTSPPSSCKGDQAPNAGPETRPGTELSCRVTVKV